MNGRRAPARWATLPLWVSLGLYGAQVAIYRRHTPYDDAFITFRYARNLAEGLGAVFNQGELVEGYTNFLWMAMLAALGFGGIDIAAAAVALGVACGAATIVLVWAWGRAAPSAALAAEWTAPGSLAALLLGLMRAFAGPLEQRDDVELQVQDPHVPTHGIGAAAVRAGPLHNPTTSG